MAEDVVIKIKADTKEYQSGLEGIADSTTSIFEKLTSPIGLVTAAIGATLAVISQGVKQFQEAESAVNALNLAMVNAGTYTAQTQNEYLKLANELQKVTTYSDDQTIAAMTVLQTHIGARKVTEDLTKATMDLAAAKKIDLSTAAELVGKAIGGEMDVLKRHNIVVDEASFKGDKLAAVVDALDKKFGGQAEAATKGAGQVVLLKNAWDDFLKAVGEKFAGEGQISKGLAKMLNWTTDLISANKLAASSYDEYNAKMQQVRIQIVKLTEQIAEYKKQGLATTFEELQLKTAEENLAKLRALRDKNRQDEQTSEENAARNIAESKAKIEEDLLKRQLDQRGTANQMIGKKDEDLRIAQYDMLIKWNQTQYDAAKTHVDKLARLRDIQVLEDKKTEELKNKALLAERDQTLGKLAGMMSSSNQFVKTMGKAAALSQIAIDTPKNANAALGAFAFIPIIGPALGYAAAAAAIAFGAENAGKVMSAAQGGLVTGGTRGVDSVPAMLMPGELVVPQKNYEEVISSVSSSRDGGGGGAHITLTLKDNLMDFIEAKIVERKALKVSIQGA